MARLAVPPIDKRLRELLLPVLANKRLGDDALWQAEILPLLHNFLDSLADLVRQSATTNANAPTALITDDIHKMLGVISRNLAGSFADAAPFTIHRVAELILAYHESGYSLNTVILARKWLTALARVLSVTSSELSYMDTRVQALPLSEGTTAGESLGVLEHERQLAELPQIIRFERLEWPKIPDVEQKRNEDDHPDEPTAKRPKPYAEEETRSPLQTNGDASLAEEIPPCVIDSSNTDEAHDMPGNASNEDSPHEQEPMQNNGIQGLLTLLVRESPDKQAQINAEGEVDTPQNETRPGSAAKYPQGRAKENQDSGLSHPAFYENGPIDQDNKMRHKEEVLI
ncbi:hypothetical protein METBIDRAFT_12819 [Metschnikowia bicuspidata var. bicuspidata NRRL YB-4993]|uniref:Uncharacterized protein n=1 Tax=Metschnikowia bicuspidata var. bicuspidata NRRL YB-4993 TaxID=869754 RepID=A0A1A0H6Q4_9ASCO|nr:hypothetical protein METBIDRAFT_12819 [Metschnikowia bicuspidata var. bicuspidata NRRL YB-4993]OBA19774.1 hypothetical protein METBIDRAFT_12819 [Metschnikowia bicuspidata var. bicuspidata NRRL YB-4993]